eukprot:15163410-Alexandrium_andersonii.AAC.1
MSLPFVVLLRSASCVYVPSAVSIVSRVLLALAIACCGACRVRIPRAQHRTTAYVCKYSGRI